jgi:NAD(P)-dependent dehydrogenase (short-subunit alcohol dehydrogenase family)
MKSLQNKNIIITGGGEGIGAEASKLLASEGANIILTCKTKEEGFFCRKRNHRQWWLCKIYRT